MHAILVGGSLRIGVLVSISAPRQDECLICVNIETIIAPIATETEIGSIILYIICEKIYSFDFIFKCDSKMVIPRTYPNYIIL